MILLNLLIFPIATYTYEACALKMVSQMLSLKCGPTEECCKSHKQNVPILEKLKITTRRSTRINQEKKHFKTDQEKINSKRPRGRSSTLEMDQTREIIGHGLQKAYLAVQDQIREMIWRSNGEKRELLWFNRRKMWSNFVENSRSRS